MSQRDRDLLDIADLTVAQAAEIFGRTPAAMYAAIARPKNYLESIHLMALVHHARRQNSPRLSLILEFIEQLIEQPDSQIDKELVLPTWGTIRQLLRACSAASQIIVLCNGNKGHLHERALFGHVLRELIPIRRGTLDVVVPHKDWEEEIMSWEMPNPNMVPNLKMESGSVELPVILTAMPESRRGFVFGRLSIEETDPVDAESLWALALLAGIQERVGARSHRIGVARTNR